MKKKIENELNEDFSLLDDIMKDAPKKDMRFVDRSNEIRAQILNMMRERGWKQKDLADAMDKSEPEISKLLNGSHNYTLRILTHIETAFNAPVFYTEVGKALEYKRRGVREYKFFATKNSDPSPLNGNYENAIPEGNGQETVAA